MGESTKSVCALLMIVGSIAAALSWTVVRPDATTWGFRVGGPITAALALGLILKLHFRTDLECDYLRAVTGNFFNRDGFCFTFVATAINGAAYMDAYFQNQYDKPCVGRIALRPARGFFMNRARIEPISYEIECPPAGFGLARIAISIPEELQGKKQSFEVGASVSYPDGKGTRLSFPRWLVSSFKYRLRRLVWHIAYRCRCCDRFDRPLETSNRDRAVAARRREKCPAR